MIEQAEMLYIYRRLSEILNTTDTGSISVEILRLRRVLKTGGKTRSLYPVFRYLQAENMQNSGHYDTSPLQPPQSDWFGLNY